MSEPAPAPAAPIPYTPGAVTQFTRYDRTTGTTIPGYIVSFSAPDIPFSGEVFVPKTQWPGATLTMIQEELRNALIALGKPAG